ncbi:MAG: hypothetical protein M3037_02220 [Gemmatimonadota bacterium]|nr:hypothetical protein [Gemmatimonadota bacterium]
MKKLDRVTITRLVWISALVASAACRSAQPRRIPSSTAGRQATPEEEITLIRADSEVFAAVVRTQVDGGDDYPYHLDRVRYDARPYGTRSGYPEVFAGVQGIDPTLTFARAGESAIDQLIDNRKHILQTSGVRSGGPFTYSQCAGVRVPVPPPVHGSAARTKRADVHAGCPKTPEYYVTVGLPIRGQPEGLKNVHDTKGHRVSLGGDVWTALVDEHSAGPKGWTWSQYAWLFKRGRWNGRLELASTILIGVVE